MSIRITTKVAFDLAKEAARLFHLGTGVVIEPLDGLAHEDHGFVDDLDENSDIRYWANQLLFFARTVHGLFNSGLLEQELLIEDE